MARLLSVLALLACSAEGRSQGVFVKASLKLIVGQKIRMAFPVVPPAPPCLRVEAARAKVILYGTLANPAMNPAGDEQNAVTDLRILTVAKADPALKNHKVITLSRYIRVADPKNPPQVLIFFDVNMGRLEISSVIPLESDAAVKYLVDALKLDAKTPDESYLFFRRHYDSPDSEIRRDARDWLTAICHEDIRPHAHCLPPDTIAAYLKNEKSPYWLRDLDARLLGDCGNERHAALLRSLIEKERTSEDLRGLSGMLIGYALLRPKAGLALLREITNEPKTPDTVRRECLRALGFFRENRPDVWTRKQLAESLAPMLSRPDNADLVIEELLELGEESVLERILALHAQKDFDVPDVHLAILRYALSFPKNPKAAQFIEDRWVEDPEMVENEEERLKP